MAMPLMAMSRSRASISLFALALLGCPSDDVTAGETSTGHGSESSGAVTTSAMSATGTIPPPSTSTGASSGEGADSTASTTLAASTGPTTGEDFGASDDHVPCGDSCGNGLLCGTEQCDCGMGPCTPEGLDFSECADLINPAFPDRVYTGGILDCSPASCRFVFTTCTFCGDGRINGNETCEPEPPPQDTCASLGLGDETEPLPCDDTCQLDTSSCRGMAMAR
jgi:hypothetical protein